MKAWQRQIETLIQPAAARSAATKEVLIDNGVLKQAGAVAARMSNTRRALVMADEAGFAAAGAPVVEALVGAGFNVKALILPVEPLPRASVEQAEPFRAALAADPALFPLSVGSGVINDLVKFAAFETDRRYMSIATAASMDGYTSAGAPLARGGFKITIPARAPIAMVADLDVIAKAPAEMNGWGYGDLAGKVPSGGDWMLAELMGVEPRDDCSWPLVQDHLQGWLAEPEGIAGGDLDAVARLFVGLTAVGFAMEAHGSSRPASGADHQIAHMWEMEGLTHRGRKVSHGAAVSVGCVAALALIDWVLEQDLTGLDDASILADAPRLSERQLELAAAITDPAIADKARAELAAKHVGRAIQADRLARLRTNWAATQKALHGHLIRQGEMVAMLRKAGAPAFGSDIGVSAQHLIATMRAAAFIRSRYTIFDFLHDTGLTETAFAAVAPRLVAASFKEARA